MAGFATAALAAGGATMHGCSTAGTVWYLIEGPPKVPAVAELDPARPTVIFVDDRGYGDQMIVPRRDLRREIGAAAEQLLLDEGVVDDGMMIRSADALRVAAAEVADSPMSIVDIGRAVGAEVIIYVDVKGFTVSRDNATISPAGAAQVKIFDTVANQQVWPPDGAYDLVVQMPRQPQDLSQIERQDVRAAERQLAAFFGVRVAQMFFEIERPSRLGTNQS